MFWQLLYESGDILIDAISMILQAGQFCHWPAILCIWYVSGNNKYKIWVGESLLTLHLLLGTKWHQLKGLSFNEAKNMLIPGRTSHLQARFFFFFSFLDSEPVSYFTEYRLKGSPAEDAEAPEPWALHPLACLLHSFIFFFLTVLSWLYKRKLGVEVKARKWRKKRDRIVCGDILWFQFQPFLTCHELKVISLTDDTGKMERQHCLPSK